MMWHPLRLVGGRGGTKSFSFFQSSVSVGLILPLLTDDSSRVSVSMILLRVMYWIVWNTKGKKKAKFSSYLSQGSGDQSNCNLHLHILNTINTYYMNTFFLCFGECNTFLNLHEKNTKWYFVQYLLSVHRYKYLGRSGWSTWKYQLLYKHWSLATLSLVSTLNGTLFKCCLSVATSP